MNMWPGAWGHHEVEARSFYRHLRGHAAGPEDRHFAFVERDGVAVVGPREIGDAEGCRIADVHRRTMRP